MHFQTTWIIDDVKLFAEIMYDILVLQKDVNETFETFDEEHLKIVEATKWETEINNN